MLQCSVCVDRTSPPYMLPPWIASVRTEVGWAVTMLRRWKSNHVGRNGKGVANAIVDMRAATEHMRDLDESPCNPICPLTWTAGPF